MNYDHLTHNQLVQAIDNLAARCTELERDAARYRWLQKRADSPILDLCPWTSAAKMDSAIDSAIEKLTTELKRV